jgi:exonuclease SbcC
LENTQAEEAKAEKADEQIKQYDTQLTDMRVRFGALQSEVKGLAGQIKNLRAKAQELPPTGSPCERCGNVMDEKARRNTLDQYAFEEDELQEQSEQRKTEKDQLEIDANKIKLKKQELEPIATLRLKLKSRVGTLEEKLKNAQQAEKKIAELQVSIDEIQKQLATKTFAVGAQQELLLVEQELAVVNYDNAAHQLVQSQYNEYRKYETEKNRLETALQLLPSYEQNLKDNAEYQVQNQREQAETERNQKELQSELSGLNELRRELARISLEVHNTRNLELEANTRLTRAKAKLEECDRATTQMSHIEKQLEQAALDKDLYNQLSQAFGKKGIQALIIDSALPELEDEANQLLSEMTSGRMSVRFDTQRDTKKGDSTIETLDIKISDELGLRPYELFSGGEAFRVNFAVRLALSKLLARRNGAQLRTLFIDEGFGTQDDKGRERLIEAIHSIENKFDRILVITHIPELKDAFPVRIDIEKTPNGSRLNIN